MNILYALDFYRHTNHKKFLTSIFNEEQSIGYLAPSALLIKTNLSFEYLLNGKCLSTFGFNIVISRSLFLFHRRAGLNIRAMDIINNHIEKYILYFVLFFILTIFLNPKLFQA
ncbi:MAG: hypothetical protein J6W29_06415, partial [Neisseriaceae bacterium]|nr:hypothetical protein [Neisseriaceae bacterium]